MTYSEARDESVPAVVDSPLVDGHPGHEPRGLQDEDGGDGYGARDAERVDGGENLEEVQECAWLIHAT